MNANIIYIGDAFGTVQADGSGNYAITVDDGTYIVSMYFSPNALAVVVAGSDVPDQDFTPTTLTVSSPLDSRAIPNFDRVVQDAQIVDADGQLPHLLRWIIVPQVLPWIAEFPRR
jgi:hypothetical protein